MIRLYYDTETTGLTPKRNRTVDNMPRIVQLAAALIDDDDGEIASLNTVIQPDGWEVPTAASDVHGITTEKAHKYGIPIMAALLVFSTFCKVADQAVAHNEAYDTPVIDFECQRMNKPCRLYDIDRFCTMKATTDILKIPGPYGFKWPKLQEAHKFFFGFEFEDAHDALADVRACAKVHKHLLSDNEIKNIV